MPRILGDGQNFKRREKDDNVEGGGGGGGNCTSLPAM